MQASSPEVRFHLMGAQLRLHRRVRFCVWAGASGAAAPCALDRAGAGRTVVVVVQRQSSGIAKKAGDFRRLASGGVVAGPIVTTISRHDMAVGSLYLIAAGVARQVDFAPGELPKYGGVGTFGLRGSGLDIEDLTVGAADFPYDFRSGRIYNINCDSVIRGRRSAVRSAQRYRAV